MINVVGLLVLVAFYVAILVVGIIAARRFNAKYRDDNKTERDLVAGRRIGGIVGIFTMTATTVGGGYINGTAESIATEGMVWTLAPLGIFLGIMLGGLIYAKKMRQSNYLTMLDPFQEKYGRGMVALLYLASICGDMFWSGSILAALGTSLSIILDLNFYIAVISSACVALLYTLFGQMISVAYTDVIQLIFIVFGLVLCLPFIFLDSRVGDIGANSSEWLGSLPTHRAGFWCDLLVTMTFGTIPWQTYFQRVLSVKTVRDAQILSFIGGTGAFLLAIPPLLIGAAATSADWNATGLGDSPMNRSESSFVLPYVLYYFTPGGVSVFGLGAVAAAVMSSTDSAILSSASMFTHNIYAQVFRKKATDRELSWVQRISVCVVAAIATAMALSISSIYGMFIMAADIVFVIMLPQLTCILFYRYSNTYGALLGYIVGVILRIGGGEYYLSLPPLIKYPYYSELDGQLFPFRTFAMLCSMLTIIFVSALMYFLFTRKILPLKLDIFGSFTEVTTDGTDTSETRDSKHEIVPWEKSKGIVPTNAEELKNEVMDTHL